MTMSSEEKIKRLFAKSNVAVNSKVDDRIVNDALTALDQSEKTQSISPDPNIWRIIMKSKITKLATAAAITIAVIIGIKGFNGTTAWAEVIKAIKNADNIHIVSRITRANGLVSEHHAWLKNRTMIYDEDSDEITIDDGANRLTLDIEKKTAQLSDSYSPFEDYMETGNFEIILLFRGEHTAFRATELPGESTGTMRVYEVIYRDVWKGKAWVDSESNLPVRIAAEVTEKYKQHALSLEVAYDYQPILLEKFSLAIPAGYTELPRIKTRLFSGKVIDEKGEPVVGAEVVTSNGDIRGRTSEHGEFAVKLHPGLSSLHRFPMIVRAFKRDDLNRVAWTLLRNPRHELRPLFRPDDGKTRLEQGRGVDIHLVDENELLEFIPGDPGKMVFENEADRYPREVTDIVLKMVPASIITGRIADRAGKAIANAVVWMDYMKIAVGENEIEIRDLGRTDKEKEMISSLNVDELRGKTSTVTDKDGFYALANLPDVWYRARLEVTADGYVTEAKEIFQEQGCNFTLLRADIRIRGTVVDNHGAPLLGREVDIDVDSDENGDFDIEEVIIDSQGRFELTNLPAVDGLELEIRADEKPRDWDRNELTRGRKFIYYLMIERPIEFEHGKKDYWVEIVPHRPDITLEIEVKDSKGNLLEGIPVGISTFGNTERIWYLTKLTGKTSENGVCIINEVPYLKPFKLWISLPTPRHMYYWEDGRDVSPEIKNAITESLGKYRPTEVTVELEREKKKYKIPVMLKAIDE
jgi:protocatechuate 3,4-dioxygenase beta subunit